MQPFAALILFGMTVCLSAAGVTLSPINVDLGVLPQEQSVTTEITVSNTGDAQLLVGEVLTDCTCTAAAPDKRVLSAHESTVIRVTLTTGLLVGDLRRKVTVRTSAGDVSAELRGHVRPFANWSAGPLPVALPSSMRGDAVRSRIRFVQDSKAELKIARVESPVPWLTAGVIRYDAERWDIDILKSPDAPGGNRQVDLLILTTSSSEPKLRLPVFVSVQTSFRIEPDPLIFPKAPAGQEVELPFVLSNWTNPESPVFSFEGGRVTVEKIEAAVIWGRLTTRSVRSGSHVRALQIRSAQGLEAEVPIILRPVF